MDSTINHVLRCEQQSWVDTVLKNYKAQIVSERKQLSHPFYMGLSDEYIQNPNGKKRVMVIGREARGYEVTNEPKDAEKNTPENSQAWAIAYFSKQIGQGNIRLPKCYEDDEELAINHSAFWNFFRWLHESASDRENTSAFVACWNNVDKVYFTKKGKKDGKLTYEAEKALSKPYRKDASESREKSLLQREIEYAKPDAVLFVTGESYGLTMQTALDIDISQAPSYEKTDSCLVKVGETENKAPIFWMNHPQGLIFKGFKKTDFEELILKRLR